jgi:hypothetical protein
VGVSKAVCPEGTVGCPVHARAKLTMAAAAKSKPTIRAVVLSKPDLQSLPCRLSEKGTNLACSGRRPTVGLGRFSAG